MIIDSLELGDPHDVTLYLSEKVPSELRWLSLKRVTLYFNKVERTKAVYIHSNILNTDENFFNGKKSDIIGVVPGLRHADYSEHTFGNVSKSLKSTDFTSIQFSLSKQIESLNRIIYELEFSG